jgi:hypothetical protein
MNKQGFYVEKFSFSILGFTKFNVFDEQDQNINVNVNKQHRKSYMYRPIFLFFLRAHVKLCIPAL